MDGGPKRTSGKRLLLLAMMPLAVIAAALVWLVLEVRAVVVAEPVIAVDYRAEFRAYAQDFAQLDAVTAEQAWLLLTNACHQADRVIRDYQEELSEAWVEPRFDGDGSLVDFSYVRDAAALAPDMEREWEALRRLRDAGVFETLAAFAEIAPGLPPLTDNETSILIEPNHSLASSRALAQARLASMRLALSNGELSEVVQGFDETLAIGRTIVNQPNMISMLVALSVHAMAIEELKSLLMESPFPADLAHMLLGSLERHRLPPADFGIEAERAMMLDVIQRVYTDDGRGSGYFSPRAAARAMDHEEKASHVAAIRARFILPTRRETTDLLSRWFDVYVDEGSREEFEELVDYLDSGADPIASLLAPALGRAVRQRRLLDFQHECLRLMLMLELHREIHGGYPSTLVDSEVGWEVPEDRIAGQAFGYRLLENDPHGRPYLLYSVGIDGVDHGGRDIEGQHDRLRIMSDPRVGEGYDYIVNAPRRGVQ